MIIIYNYEKLLLKLMKENKLNENDAISLAFANWHYKNNTNPPINHNIAPTIITGGHVIVVEKERE